MNATAGSACSRQVLALIAFVTAVRVVVSGQLELTSVESYSWLCSRWPALGYYDHPGMIAWMGAFSTGIFGPSALGFRALSVASSGGMIWLVFLAGRRLYGEAVGRLAAILAALVPLMFAYSAEATPDAPCLFFWSATIWALAHVLSGDSPRWWAPAGLFLGLAMDSKYHAVFLGLGVLGFLLFSPEQRPWLRRKEPWIAAALALLAFSPTILWNARHGWESFAYQGLSRFKEGGFQATQLGHFPLSQLYLLTPVVAVWAWGAGIAVLLTWRRADWKDRFLSALGTPALLFFATMLLVRPVRGHWTAPGYVSLLILVAEVVSRGGLWGRRLHGGSLVLLACGVLFLPLVLAFIPKDQRSGWAVLAAQVERRRPDFIVCNDYHVASQMGFALQTRQSWDLTPIGKPSKSFPNWWNERELLGRTAVIVYDSQHFPGELDRLKACFKEVDPPELVAVPRIRLRTAGEDERYWLLSARTYLGTRIMEPRAPGSND